MLSPLSDSEDQETEGFGKVFVGERKKEVRAGRFMFPLFNDY